jgi:spermidine synthase
MGVDSSIKPFSNILIIGGGDFIIANRMISKYSNLNIKIDIVDIDKEVSDAVIAHFNYALPSNCEIEYKCGYEYIKHCQKKYDAIILDITDPAELLNTPASVLISEDFYLNLLRCANENANIIQQYGSYEYFKNNLNDTSNLIFPSIIKNQKFTTKYMDEYFDELIFLHILK